MVISRRERFADARSRIEDDYSGAALCDLVDLGADGPDGATLQAIHACAALAAGCSGADYRIPMHTVIKSPGKLGDNSILLPYTTLCCK